MENFRHEVTSLRRYMWTRIVRRLICPGVERQKLQALTTRQTSALRQHDPFEPARKRRRFAELRQLLPLDDERFLRGVLCEIGVAQHCKRTGEGHVLKTDHEFAKGFASCLWSAIRISRAADDFVNVFHLKLASINKSQNQANSLPVSLRWATKIHPQITQKKSA